MIILLLVMSVLLKKKNKKRKKERKKGKVSYYALKLDMNKAYDRWNDII